MARISKNDYLEWLAIPVTQLYFDGIKEKIAQIELHLGAGSFLNTENPHETAMQYAKAVGRIEGLNDKLDIEAEFNDET